MYILQAWKMSNLAQEKREANETLLRWRWEFADALDAEWEGLTGKPSMVPTDGLGKQKCHSQESCCLNSEEPWSPRDLAGGDCKGGDCLPRRGNMNDDAVQYLR